MYTEASLLAFYCNRITEDSQLCVSWLQLNLPRYCKSVVIIAAKKETSDWVDYTIRADKKGAEISVYI